MGPLLNKKNNYGSQIGPYSVKPVRHTRTAEQITFTVWELIKVKIKNTSHVLNCFERNLFRYWGAQGIGKWNQGQIKCILEGQTDF